MGPQEKEDILYVSDKRYSHLYSELSDSRKTARVSWAAVEAYPDNLQYVPREHLDRDMIKMAAGIDGFAIEHVPSDRLDSEICSIAVNTNGGALEFVPAHLLTPQLCLDAVTNQPLALEVVPLHMRDKDLCHLALGKDGEALEFVPRKFITEEMCLDAVQDSGWALEFVPEEMKTKDICRIALTSSPDLGGDDYAILEFVPFSDICLEGLQLFENSLAEPIDIFSSINPKLIDSEIALFGVKMDPLIFHKIPEHLQTPEILMEAVSHNGLILGHIPEHKVTQELCEAAVKSLYPAMCYVPDKFKTADFCAMALQESPFTIQYFPKEHLTREVCREAIKKETVPEILKYIPFEDIKEKACKEFCVDFDTTKKFLQSLGEKHLTQKMADIIFDKGPLIHTINKISFENSDLFYYIPDKFKTKEMCEAAVQQDGLLLRYVPDNLKTDDIYMTAFRQNPLAIGAVPDKWRNETFFTALVEENPVNLKGVPRDERTADMCLKALEIAEGNPDIYYTVVSAITDSKLLLEVFEQENDPEEIGTLLGVADRDTIDSEIARDAMSKNGKYIYILRQDVISSDVAEAAVKNYPRSITFVPENLRTPDMYLFANKKASNYHLPVPDEIRLGSNIYSFHKKVEQMIGKQLSYENHNKLYKGETVIVKDVIAGGSMLERAELLYDWQSNKLKIQPAGLSVDKKEDNTQISGRKNIQKRNTNKL